ncbi:MAG: ribonuclease Y [Candidatus Kapabacteria bacterium]|nr:ribonuclease Y [Candidatus Kapabacteria bacterium]
MSELIIVIVSAVGLIAGYYASYIMSNKLAAGKIANAEDRAKNIVSEAEKEANNNKKEKLLEVKEEWHKRKQEFESEAQSRKMKMQQAEKQVKYNQDAVDQRNEELKKKERNLQSQLDQLPKREETIKNKTAEAEKLVLDQKKKLEEISGLSRDEAKRELISNFINEAKTEAGQMINKIRDEAKSTAQREAQGIIIQAIQRTASDHSVETTVSVVNLESDEMKGRIIGREGRNIRAFEAATGIDLIIDDTPEAVVISGFDPFRREVAKKALEKLMLDGRIHPTRIEELVEKTKKELEEDIVKIGEATTLDLGLHGMHPELLKYVGKMKYRSSYGQNLLNHSIEVAYVCGIMAAELGLDTKIAKRAGLLHDIGKCVDKDTEGPHAIIGYELAKKYKEIPAVFNAIGAHHEDIEMETPYAVLVQAADSISGARPGARRESLENYVKRLEKLEGLANNFEGVAKTFAIQAGREVRVIVEPEKVDDSSADSMAAEIAKKIESEMEYPGQIKVTVIRERRSVSVAK